MKKVILLLVLVCWGTSLCAESDGNLSAANALYQKQDYEAALEQYENLLHNSIQNSDLYYNLGNTYFRLEKLGYARLYYEKAAKLAPHDKDIQHNLLILKKLIQDKEDEQKNPIEAIGRNLFYALSLNALCWIWLALFVTIIMMIIIILRTKKIRWKYILLSVQSFIFIAILSISIMRYVVMTRSFDGVIIEETAVAYSGPSKEFSQVFVIHEGLKVRIERRENSWALIKLSSGNGGWIQDFLLEEI